MQIDHAVNLISRTSSVQLTVVPVVIVVRSGYHRLDRNHPSDCEQEARLHLERPVVLCRFETTTAIRPSSYTETLGGKFNSSATKVDRTSMLSPGSYLLLVLNDLDFIL